MRLRLVLILSVSSLFSASIGDGAPAPLQDKDKIQGKWTGIGGEENGRQFTEEETVMEEEVFIFRGDQVTFLTVPDFGAGRIIDGNRPGKRISASSGANRYGNDAC